MNTKAAFFKESIKTIKTTGTITPSSKFLINKMLNEIDFDKNNIIVELGAGNGIITNQLLTKINKNSKLICFEINNEFYNHLSLINDQRLTIFNSSAEKIKLELLKIGIENVDYIISSIPLTILPKNISQNILNLSRSILKNNGVFIQYLYSFNFVKFFKNIYGNSNVIVNFEILNIPPAFIYKCKKATFIK